MNIQNKALFYVPVTLHRGDTNPTGSLVQVPNVSTLPDAGNATSLVYFLTQAFGHSQPGIYTLNASKTWTLSLDTLTLSGIILNGGSIDIFSNTIAPYNVSNQKGNLMFRNGISVPLVSAIPAKDGAIWALVVPLLNNGISDSGVLV